MQKEIRIIIASTIFILVFGVFSYAVMNRASDSESDTMAVGSWACSADPQICPDGSEVYRTPPYCQFASCPR